MSRQPSPMSRRPWRQPDGDDSSLASDSSALHPGRVAVITGAASGIGFAAAKKFARNGLHVVISDVDEDKLKDAHERIAALAKQPDMIVSVVADVSRIADVEKLRDAAFQAFGEINLLLHAAAVNRGSDGKIGGAFGGLTAWKAVLDVNLGGTINVVQTFVPYMSGLENPAAIIITGSKQGISNPPGNAAYNVSKSAVKTLTENVAHELRARGSRTSAHLFIPGWTWTPLAGAAPGKQKPDGAWTPEETVRYMCDKVRQGDFYIVCPDNETSSHLDSLRFKWAAEDITENRPALSRWHPEYTPLFQEYINDNINNSE